MSPDAFDPALNPLDARLAVVARDEPILYATLTAWQHGALTRAEALTRAIELLAKNGASLRRALHRSLSEAPPPVMMIVAPRTRVREPAWDWRGDYHGWLWDCGCLIGAEALHPARAERCMRCSTKRPAGPPDERQPQPLSPDGKGWR